MKRHARLIFWILLPALILIISSCSKAKSPVEPGNIENLPDSFGIAEGAGNHQAVAVYDLIIDPVNQTVTLVPSTDRAAEYHIPLSNYYPNVLSITGYGWTPNFWADIRITHPFPLSDVVGFDPRVIAIIPANNGVSFFYPVFNVKGNNKALMNSDGYTPLWDKIGGSIPGNVNPFIAYFKEYPYRTWEASNPEDTRRFEINLAGFGGPMRFKLVVDVSTNYPQLGIPLQDNAPEPVEMKASIGDGLRSGGGRTSVEATITDWQGASNIRCKVESPSLFTGAIQLTYSKPGAKANEYVFSGLITNQLSAPAGEYSILIAAWDIPKDVHIYSEWIVKVGQDISFNPVDVTPELPEYGPWDIKIKGNLAFSADWEGYLHILDISTPTRMVLIKTITMPGGVFGVDVTDEYAFVVGRFNFDTLQVVDINPPEEAHIVKVIDLPDEGRGIAVSGGYAYIANSYDGCVIVDIDPLETASICKTVDTLYPAIDISLEGNYAYLLLYSYLFIIDISVPESAYYVKSTGWGNNYATSVDVLNGYAFVSDCDKIQIIDVDPPQSVHIVKTVGDQMFDNFGGVRAKDGYLFAASLINGMYVFDVDPPENASFIRFVPSSEECIDISEGYAYVGERSYGGISIIDIDPPESSYRVSTAGWNCRLTDICAVGDYAYASDENMGLTVIDISTPESAKITDSLYIGDRSDSVYIWDHYALVTAYRFGLLIYDVVDPDHVNLVKTVYMADLIESTYAEDGYAYVADGHSGLQIIDISPIDSAHIVKTVDTPHFACGVWEENGYCYISDGEGGLQIIDVEPPEMAGIVKSIAMENANSVVVGSGYAYITDATTGLHIVDITSPESAYIVNTVDTPGFAMNVFISGGYAYVADGDSGLQIIDILNPQSAGIVGSMDTPGSATGVWISNSYAYIADYYEGLRIIKLF